jgi:hypothetical protein
MNKAFVSYLVDEVEDFEAARAYLKMHSDDDDKATPTPPSDEVGYALTMNFRTAATNNWEELLDDANPFPTWDIWKIDLSSLPESRVDETIQHFNANRWCHLEHLVLPSICPSHFLRMILNFKTGDSKFLRLRTIEDLTHSLGQSDIDHIITVFKQYHVLVRTEVQESGVHHVQAAFITVNGGPPSNTIIGTCCVRMVLHRTIPAPPDDLPLILVSG